MNKKKIKKEAARQFLEGHTIHSESSQKKTIFPVAFINPICEVPMQKHM